MQVTRGHEQHSVAIHNVAVAIGKKRTVRVAVEGYAHHCSTLPHTLRDNLRIECAAVIVDVFPVRIVVNKFDVKPEHGKQFGGARTCRAVRTVDDYLSSNLWLGNTGS